MAGRKAGTNSGYDIPRTPSVEEIAKVVQPLAPDCEAIARALLANFIVRSK